MGLGEIRAGSAEDEAGLAKVSEGRRLLRGRGLF